MVDNLYSDIPPPPFPLESEFLPLWIILDKIKDPEVPVLSIIDLGLVRGIYNKDNSLHIDITPTYTGCPAMDMIAFNINTVLEEAGYVDVILNTVISPPWTTDWISERGKQNLLDYGIAPPSQSADKALLSGQDRPKQCPHCGSVDTKLISLFGSTACKSLYKCLECLEPFDYFKCH